ncbi:MAG: hypothetical protein P0S95_03100 [Rhabdochlamydiaceae bacterium]|nr:hypothetical protein [Candidatus Amphrikana amoebophyrae]
MANPTTFNPNDRVVIVQATPYTPKAVIIYNASPCGDFSPIRLAYDIIHQPLFRPLVMNYTPQVFNFENTPLNHTAIITQDQCPLYTPIIVIFKQNSGLVNALFGPFPISFQDESRTYILSVRKETPPVRQEYLRGVGRGVGTPHLGKNHLKRD